MALFSGLSNSQQATVAQPADSTATVNPYVITVKRCPIVNAPDFTYFVLEDAALNHPMVVEFNATALDGSPLVFSGKKKTQWTYKGIDLSKPITNIKGGSFRVVSRENDPNLAMFERQVYQLQTIKYLSQYRQNISNIEMLTFPMVQRFDLRKVEGRLGNFVEVHGDESINDVSVWVWSETAEQWSPFYRGPNNSRIAWNGEGTAKFCIQPYSNGILEPTYKLKSLTFTSKVDIKDFQITSIGADQFTIWSTDLVSPDYDLITLKTDSTSVSYTSKETSGHWISRPILGSKEIEIVQKKGGAYLRSQNLKIPKSYPKNAEIIFEENNEGEIIFRLQLDIDKLYLGQHEKLRDTDSMRVLESQRLIYKMMIIEHNSLGSKLHALWPLEFNVSGNSSQIELVSSNAPIMTDRVDENEFIVQYDKKNLASGSIYEIKIMEWTVGIEMSRVQQEPVGTVITDTGDNVQTTTINFWEQQHPTAVIDSICPPNDIQNLFFGIPKSLYQTCDIPGTIQILPSASNTPVELTIEDPVLQSLVGLHSVMGDNNGKIDAILAKVRIPGSQRFDEIKVSYSFDSENYTVLNSYSGLQTVDVPHLFLARDLGLSLSYRIQYYQQGTQKEFRELFYSYNSINSIRSSILSHNTLLGAAQ